MGKIQRYFVSLSVNQEIPDDENGHWVKYSDYQKELAAITAERDGLKAAGKYLLSFVPAWAKEVPEGLAPMFYGTLTADGDREVKKWVDEIRKILGKE